MTQEPVVTAAVVAVLSILVARFGFDATADQVAAVGAVVAAIVNIIARHFVTPVKEV